MLNIDGANNFAFNTKTRNLHLLKDGIDLGEIDFNEDKEPQERFAFQRHDLNTKIINPALAGKIGEPSDY